MHFCREIFYFGNESVCDYVQIANYKGKNILNILNDFTESHVLSLMSVIIK